MPHQGVLVVVETAGGIARPAALELFGLAEQLKTTLSPVNALVIGHQVSGVVDQVARLGPERVFVVDEPPFAELVASRVTRALLAAWAQLSPALVLLPGTTLGRDVAALAAATQGVPHLVDVVTVSVGDTEVRATRPVYQSKLLTTVRTSRSRPVVLTVRAGTYRAPDPAASAAVIESLTVSFTEADQRIEVTRLVEKPRGQVDLEHAPVVVVGGRGIGGPEGFDQLTELARLLGGAVGCTRAVSDLGWRPHADQIGQTGKQVRPRLYLGVGVSGAMQHTVGMQGSETVVVINRDRNASLVRFADCAIIADWQEIVPRLIARLRERREGAR